MRSHDVWESWGCCLCADLGECVSLVEMVCSGAVDVRCEVQRRVLIVV